MHQLTISTLSPEQSQLLHPLLRQQLEEELSLFQRPSLLTHLHTSDQTIQRLIDFWCGESSVHILVAMQNEIILGFIAAQLKNDIYNNQDVLSGEVLALYVSQDHRQQGLGTKMLEQAELWFKQSGAYAVNVSWLLGNDPSRSLYQKFGFEAVYCTGRKLL